MMKTIFLFLAMILGSGSGAATEVSYGKDPAQHMDLYMPSGATNAPVMLYVHGGGWAKGDKSRVGNKAEFFTSRGWIFISANYRLLPDGVHPNNVNDVARAIAWVHDHIAQKGGNKDEIFIMGHSAGAHLVALVSTDVRPLKRTGKELSIIKGVIALDTQAYDIPRLLEEQQATLYRRVFSDDAAVWRDASPITHVKAGKDVPPFLICYSRGMSKRLNPGRPRQAHAFAIALRDAGGAATVIDASDRNHGEINQWFGKPNDEKVTGAAEAFLGSIKEKPSNHPREP